MAELGEDPDELRDLATRIGGRRAAARGHLLHSRHQYDFACDGSGFGELHGTRRLVERNAGGDLSA